MSILCIKEWLQRRATVSELEVEYLVNGLPFGFCNGEWNALKATIKPGDQLWTFSSSQETWDRHMGFEGIALLRAGEVVDFLLTALN